MSPLEPIALATALLLALVAILVLWLLTTMTPQPLRVRRQLTRAERRAALRRSR